MGGEAGEALAAPEESRERLLVGGATKKVVGRWGRPVGPLPRVGILKVGGSIEY